MQPSATLPQSQPACLSDVATGLVDCGNWAVSAIWAVPATRHLGHLHRQAHTRGPRNGRASHIAFIVRDDASHSDLLFQTSDTTWQAYNTYGGNSLYVGVARRARLQGELQPPVHHALPRFPTARPDWLFNAEYPMVRWLERNGYDVSYSTGVDTDRRGSAAGAPRVHVGRPRRVLVRRPARERRGGA